MIGDQAEYDARRDEAREEEARMEDHGKFNPSNHIIQLRGGRGGSGDYLPVAPRIAWFRDRYPQGVIEVAHIRIDDTSAIFRATVETGEGGKAVGYGSETPQDFRDYIEKASTKAVGRALLALGFGTLQAGEELDEGATLNADRPERDIGQMRIVDAPVDLAASRGRQPGNDEYRSNRERAVERGRAQNQGGTPAELQLATERQIKFIFAIGHEAGLDDQEVANWCEELYGQSEVAKLNRRDASSLIEAIQRRRNEVM